MALREFADDDGRPWQVWESRPGRAPSNSAQERYFEAGSAAAGDNPSRFTPGRSDGWLTFRSGSDKRRLSPIPDKWEQADERALRRYLAAADVIAPTAGRVDVQAEPHEKEGDR